jgi:hypothetical protein
MIAADMNVRDLVERYPATREVLDRYGLRGCGGRLGPFETVRFFARAHAVDEPSLLRELEAAATAATPGKPAPVAAPSLADRIFRRFFLAGIAVVLTAGATWGALLLLRIGGAARFGVASIAEINAHGHAQIFGWVGLFIMGFAYQAFPRWRHAALPWPGLANASFYLMLGSVLVRAVAEPLGFLGAGLVAGAAQIAAAGIFAAIVARILAPEGPRAWRRLEPEALFILSAAAWFVLASAYDVALFVLTTTAADGPTLVSRVATFQWPLRDMQIHGLALLMILGASQRMLPAIFGFGAPPAPRRARAALVVLNAAIVLEIAAFLAMRLAGAHVAGGIGLEAAWLALLGGSIAIVLPFRLHAAPGEASRASKLVRAAYAWLFVSLAMLALAPVYASAVGLPFSHAWYGATRHAITVGFISQMIVAVAAKVVPTLCGTDPARLDGLAGPFALLNLGCFLRCSLQVATDVTPGAFAYIGASGALEVTALALWGLPLAKLILDSRREFDAAPEEIRTVGPQQKVGPLVEARPETLAVFEAFGFRELANPLLRRTIGRATSIRQACRAKGVDEAKLLAALGEALAGRAHTCSCCGTCSSPEPPPRPLPVVR